MFGSTQIGEPYPSLLQSYHLGMVNLGQIGEAYMNCIKSIIGANLYEVGAKTKSHSLYFFPSFLSHEIPDYTVRGKEKFFPHRDKSQVSRELIQSVPNQCFSSIWTLRTHAMPMFSLNDGKITCTESRNNEKAGVLVSSCVNLTQTPVILEEMILFEELRSSEWPMDLSLRRFID